MANYDPNLPQEFAHMPKRRRGLGAVMLLLALIAAFALAALLSTLGRQTPSGGGAPASTDTSTGVDMRPAPDPGIPRPAK